MTDGPAVALGTVTLPDFGEPADQPVIPAAAYPARLARALDRAAAAGLDALIVYGDREHAANLHFLTGYDPRFEEALLVAVPGRTPTLMVGNEGWGYAELAGGTFERVKLGSFSLMGQGRDPAVRLGDLLRAAGIRAGQAIGMTGWKYYGPRDGGDESWLDVPSWIADTVRGLTGAHGRVVNAGAIFMDPADGLRAVNDVDQLAAFEFAATHTSSALRRLLFAIRPGMSEFEAVQAMGLNGLPLSAHLMLSSGPRAHHGLPSPSSRVIEAGDPVFVAYGVWGALNARAGFMVSAGDELPPGIADYVERLVAPYFAAIVEWYETVGIGVSGATLHEVVARRLGDPFFGVGLNPGHLIHTDEWVHSPIAAGSGIALRSGMALQVDVIPATRSPWFTTNIEDGIALADDALREAFAAKYPGAWARIEARRAFMSAVLGIRLKPEVLPFSNIPAWLAPYLLAPGRAMVARR